MDADARLDAAVGSVAEEATKLLEALGSQRSARTTATPQAAAPPDPTRSPGSPADHAEHAEYSGHGEHSEHVHVAMGDAETCTWCPVCRSVTLLKGVSPETLGRLSDLATAAATVFADLASRHTSGSSGDAPRSPTERSARTEPITVVDEEDLP